MDPSVSSGSALKDLESGGGKSRTEDLRIIGGLVALVVGIAALVALVIFALYKLQSSDANSAVTGGIAAIASMVGAYFGVKIGSDGTKDAIKNQATTSKEALAAQKQDATEHLERQKDEATTTTGLALTLHPDDVGKALQIIKELKSAG